VYSPKGDVGGDEDLGMGSVCIRGVRFIVGDGQSKGQPDSLHFLKPVREVLYCPGKQGVRISSRLRETHSCGNSLQRNQRASFSRNRKTSWVEHRRGGKEGM